MSATLDPDLTTPRGSSTPHIILLVSLVASLAAPQSPYRRPIACFILTSLAIKANRSAPFTQSLDDAQPWSLLWPYWLSVTTAIALSSTEVPEESYWHLDRPCAEAKHMSAFGWRKIRWAASFVVNMRGVRWSHQVKNVPYQPSMSRGQFLKKRGLETVKVLLMTDLLLQLGIRLIWSGMTPTIDRRISDVDLIPGLLKTAVFGIGPYFFISLQYDVISLLAVATGWGQPRDWPPFFGDIKQVTTVRHFWGTFWHQSVRWPLSKIAKSVAHTGGAASGSTASSYIQLYIAFILSGFFHAQSMLMLPCHINLTPFDQTAGVFAFFLMQAVAITAEDLVLWTWKSRDGKPEGSHSARWRTLLGRVWVTGWLLFSLPWAGNPMVRVGLTQKSFLPFTLVGHLLQSL